LLIGNDRAFIAAVPEIVPTPTADAEVRRVIDAVWRIESPRLIAGLARMMRTPDVGLAEELAQDALVAALEQWPADGVPENPGAWLMAVAKRRAIDAVRRRKMITRAHEQIARTFPQPSVREADDARQATDASIDNQMWREASHDAHETQGASPTDDAGGDLLRLIFTACHPVLSTEARAALTLRLLGGLTTDEIARAFLASEPTIAQRIVRAKRTLNQEKVPFEVPGRNELAERLESVLEVLYLIFNEGYTATAGDDWMRPGLCEDALRLGRMLAELMPREPEVHGLVALMEIQASRSKARIGTDGEPILLMDQNRALWDQLLIRRGLAALQRAQILAQASRQHGTYALQAAIAACHAQARSANETDWQRIVMLYEELGRVTPSPVVELNRAVAVSMAFGAHAGLEIVDALVRSGALRDYHLLPSVRGDLLVKLGRRAEAGPEFEKAAALTRNTRERDLLLRRARLCDE
jgi:RNA polymerase sigma factor (sigma-70 family)